MSTCEVLPIKQLHFFHLIYFRHILMLLLFRVIQDIRLFPFRTVIQLKYHDRSSHVASALVFFTVEGSGVQRYECGKVIR